MVAANTVSTLHTVYLALFAVMSIYVLLVPLVFVLRYRYFIRRFDGTIYLKRFRVGWPIMSIGIELMCIAGVMVSAWLLEWFPLPQDQWLLLTITAISLGPLCMLVGLALPADGFQYLRTRSRQIPAKH